ncbi:MAG: hypothetical protein EOO65_05060 [Methanosarcinales archaeon]|nr:MAG: hypothetical protein EOO65_05060 [Methanosarcinales archaeon]
MQELNVSGCTQLSDAAFAGLPQLKRLTLRWCTQSSITSTVRALYEGGACSKGSCPTFASRFFAQRRAPLPTADVLPMPAEAHDGNYAERAVWIAEQSQAGSDELIVAAGARWGVPFGVGGWMLHRAIYGVHGAWVDVTRTVQAEWLEGLRVGHIQFRVADIVDIDPAPERVKKLQLEWRQLCDAGIHGDGAFLHSASTCERIGEYKRGFWRTPAAALAQVEEPMPRQFIRHPFFALLRNVTLAPATDPSAAVDRTHFIRTRMEAETEFVRQAVIGYWTRRWPSGVQSTQFSAIMTTNFVGHPSPADGVPWVLRIQWHTRCYSCWRERRDSCAECADIVWSQVLREGDLFEWDPRSVRL